MSKDHDVGPRVSRSALDMREDEFRVLGHALIDRIAEFYGSLAERKVTGTLNPAGIRELLGPDELPDDGTDPAQLLAESAPLLFRHSLHNGHPKFMGYITSSAAPLGALADLLASALNANLARWELSPVASEIETRAVRWVADFIGYDPNASGLMVSGGTMANFVGFVAARTAMATWDIRNSGLYASERPLTAYVSAETHTWIQKAADVAGLGADAIRWVDIDGQGRMKTEHLQQLISADREKGCLPFLVVGTAGTISRGVVDPLRELAAVCAEENLWFHVDGAYGAPAAALDDVPDDLHALSQADSVAVDPHKWLYCPIEVGCILTKHEHALKAAFGFTPPYYRLDGRRAGGTNFYELGMQNTRSFRALKVWLMFRAIGRAGYRDTIREDIRLARRLFELVDGHPDFAANAVNLSVATFRYVPRDLDSGESQDVDSYLDTLNQALLAELQAGGELFLSNAVVNGRYLLRACIVNFRTSETDIESVPGIIAEVGQRLDRELRARRSARPTGDVK